MNTRTCTAIAATLSLLAGVAHATDTTTGHLSWDCNHPGAPNLEDVKTLYDTPSNYLASILRDRLQSQLRAACQRGVEHVLVVLNPAPTPTRTLVAVDSHPNGRVDADPGAPRIAKASP
jgi:hypothetical protein